MTAVRRSTRVSRVRRTATRYRESDGTNDGSIMAIIITVHMPTNDAAPVSHACPGLRIHIIDIAQPPGIGIPAMSDMDALQPIVSAALTANISADTAKNASSDGGSDGWRCAFSRSRG